MTNAVRPTPDSDTYQEFQATVAAATPVDWYGYEPTIGGFVQLSGYAVESEFVLYAHGRAGILLRDIAYVTASCTGQYVIDRHALPVRTIRTGYLPDPDAGNGCTIRLAAIAQDQTLRIFANGTQLVNVTIERPAALGLPFPELISIGEEVTMLDLGTQLWSLGPI